MAYYGALAAGAIVSLIPPQNEASEADVAARLEQAQTKLLITDSELLKLAEPASKLAGVVPLMTLDVSGQKWPCLDDMIALGNPCANFFELDSQELVDETVAFINRTSGSSGNVKSVLTSHAHFIATMEATSRTIPQNTDPTTDVWLASLPLGFFISAKLFMGLNIILGIPVVLMRGSLDATSISILDRHRINFLFITPPLAAKLARADLKQTDVSRIKWLLTAGAPMHENLRRAVSEKFGGVPLTLEWGTSETMLIAIQTDESSRQMGSSGTLVSGMQAKVIDPQTGSECVVKQEGEILVRNLLARFKGYKDNELANRDFDKDGWFHTGDYGFLDEDSNVYIVDRIKELLKVGDGYGTHISTAELESVIFEHPAVSSVVVVGVRNEAVQQDEPAAFVILKPEYEGNVRQVCEEIDQYAKKQLTGLRRLTGGIHPISHYPMTGFKVNRRALKTMFSTPSLHLTSGQRIETSLNVSG